MNDPCLPMSNNNRPEVEIDLMRAYFEQSGISKYELATRLGWVRPNIDRVNRALGYRPDSNSRRPGVRKKPRRRMSYTRALEFLEALGADPYEIGL